MERLRHFWRRLSALEKAQPHLTTFLAAVFTVLAIPVLLGVVLVIAELSEAYSLYRFNHLSAAEHLTMAQEACHSKQYGAACLDPIEAARHLNKIPSDSPEH